MESYYLGIDVSKGYADFQLLDQTKRCVEPNFQLDDTFDGHAQLYRFLSHFGQAHPEAIIFAAVESTGGYENNWYATLRRSQATLRLQVARLNPLGVHANARADLKRVVTDKISARNIAEYLIAHAEKVRYDEDDDLAGLRKQWKFVKMLTKQQTQLFNQLESLLYTANTEVLVYCKDGVPQWVLKLLCRYPTAKKLARAKPAAVAKIPYVSTARASELVQQARKSVASVDDAVTERLLCETAKQILHLEQLIKTQSQSMQAQCTIPEIALLNTFTGISDSSSIGLMLEIQTVTHFLRSKNLTSFFGLHPVFRESGDGT